MQKFETKRLPVQRDCAAPDGSDVRLLLGVKNGALAHFQLGTDQVSIAVTHKTVDEVWYILSGQGEMWRLNNQQEEVILLEPGVSLTIPLGTKFQFRTIGDKPLAAIGMTTPPWPGEDEAVVVEGKWEPTFKK